ncbi:5-oxoprolinase subunit PxpB [Gracilibacillus sp. YIM 98692]|uniref:5-oxoprolinase subunit PxpB n=1 Tax=Gracilibacillus sp. YIM 98692 TaxID=2663532 RepID=UPI0013D713DE|nr:5-oxoprolinase subunit PxpB [Gracilibacillus sp. YIM 98692]
MQFFYISENAVMLQLTEHFTAETTQRLIALHKKIEQDSPHGVIESVLGYTTLTVYFDWIYLSHQEIQDYLTKLLQEPLEQQKQGTHHNIPVCYEKEYAPDLSFVAKYHDLSIEEVIQKHTNNTYTVSFLGFSPGFPFLSGMDTNIATPRKDKPRLEVPKGSVGIAGEQTGMYPSTSPGGWQVVGRSPVSLLHLYKKEPTLMKAGDTVSFYPINKYTFQQYQSKETVT